MILLRVCKLYFCDHSMQVPAWLDAAHIFACRSQSDQEARGLVCSERVSRVPLKDSGTKAVKLSAWTLDLCDPIHPPIHLVAS